MRELPRRGLLNLRGQPEHSAFTDAVRAVTALELPAPDEWVGDDALWVIGLAPDEWLLVCEFGAQDELASALRTAFASLFAAVTDVSSGAVTIEVSGLQARGLLARGCSVDLHARVFGAGRCAQTLLAKADVIVVQKDDLPTFEVIVRRSLAGYLWRWLTDASRDVDVIGGA